MTQLWSPEQAISIKKARKLIEEQFPRLNPAKIEVIGEGFDNSVFLVNEQVVFRFPRRQIAVELLNTENRILPVLAPASPVPIPNPRYQGKTDGEYPWPFAGYDKIEGHVPSRLTDEERLQSTKPLAEFLRFLHHFPVDEAKNLWVPYDTMGRVNIKKRIPMIKENLEKAEQLNLMNEAMASAVQQFLETVPDYLTDDTLVLCHGDLHIRNILLDDSKTISGIIDWGDVHIGSPAVDLSIIYSFLPPRGRPIFFQTYGEVTKSVKILARIKAIHTSLLLLIYGADLNDADLVRESNAAIRLACMQ